MGFSSKKIGFGGNKSIPKKNKPYTDKKLAEIKFEAIKMHQKNRHDKAVIAYKKLIKFGTKDDEVFLNLYQIYKEQLRIKDASVLYKKIILETNINYAEITIDFLKFILDNNQDEFANQIVIESLEKKREIESILSFYSKILVEKNEMELALNFLKKGLENCPSSVMLLSNIGYILQSLKQ